MTNTGEENLAEYEAFNAQSFYEVMNQVTEYLKKNFPLPFLTKVSSLGAVFSVMCQSGFSVVSQTSSTPKLLHMVSLDMCERVSV